MSELQNHIRTLASVEETEAPLISCYFDMRKRPLGYLDQLEARIRLLRKTLSPSLLGDFEQAAARIAICLGEPIAPATQGLAVFARGGKQPFYLSLEFEAPLPNWVAVGSTPNIYHLVELKDNYDRYVILLTTETSARIIGVNLGSVTTQLLQSRPDLRRRAGREWTKEHFQNHRRERTRQFIHDQIRSLDQALSAGGYGHLILAGNPQMCAAVRKVLPRKLADMLIDSVPAGAGDRVSDIVSSTLLTFLEHEEEESQAVAEKLIRQIHTHGLAVAGARASMDALKAAQADFLIVLKSYDAGQGWECRECGKLEFDLPRPNKCPACGTSRIRDFDIRGELVRLAEQQQIGIEVVEHNDSLMSLGGIGCLLRYRAPGNYLYSAA